MWELSSQESNYACKSLEPKLKTDYLRSGFFICNIPLRNCFSVQIAMEMSMFRLPKKIFLIKTKWKFIKKNLISDSGIEMQEETWEYSHMHIIVDRNPRMIN